jgi:SP family facilitated glucose transporter-like MFS transporter 1
LWNILLGLPVITCVLGAGLLFIFFPETPSALLRKNKDPKQAKKALERLRQSDHVEDELESIQLELNKDSKSSSSFSIADLFTRPELRWPLITGLVIQIAQQLCGVNAVNMIILVESIFNIFFFSKIFFYSGIIFKTAGISEDNIQYAVGLTGIINVTATIIAVPLIDKAGRKPLLVYPMAFMVLDFIVLTILLIFGVGFR